MTNDSAPATRLHSIKRVAQMIDVSRTTIFRLIQRRELTAVHLSSRCTRVVAASVDDYIARRSAPNVHE
jgi:excisionase family DNA binding protein